MLHRQAARRSAYPLIAALALTGAVAAPVHAATAASTAAPAQLSVFAWNIDLATTIVDSTESENAAGRTPVIESVIRKHDADVVILDEAFNDTSDKQIPAALHDLYPYATPVVGLTCSGGGWTGISGDCSNSPFVINGGTMILSKYPIQAQYAHVFKNSTFGTWDYEANKGADLVKLNVDGTTAWVVGTHLQADQSGTSTNTTEKTRLAQLGEIKSWVNGIVGTSAPVLIGGDLNVEYYGGASRGDYANAQNAAGGVLGSPALDPNQGLSTMDCPISSWCQYMAGVESFPTDLQDDMDYLGYLNDGTRPVPTSLPTVGIAFDPQAGWTSGQLDTNAPSDHYPVTATFALP
ncbi:sphingomyelin phosphodiesterase [Streptacidiphilus anmyonensis]|uniref:sphingomyelin phosphodiesterase n=1 Tax=Streptacidiphilus anmyonensis TaxID=405782 RepID=UPI0005AB65C3|nr:sphingomyelin phosphodiesterase [Streptacidiphilus anmyonensis]